MIPSSEFAGRRDRARQAIREAGLAGLLVCSRGGGTTDRYADVKYLTNFYTRFPYIPDVPGEWTGRAHAFVILPADGEPVLVADDRPERDSDLAIGDVTVTGDVTGSVIAAMLKAGLAGGR
ncbi:MAG: aminopeptidase P family N-terminal domain-containing protein, partial [Alphaproteobacteria bacterium]|nr:aminopeptidase P family N-terminal domain-containing protein [Alphaproteobacteria bacterium]